MDLRRGSQVAVDRVVNFLATNTKTITTTAEIAQVATISANGDVHVGNLIAQAMEKVSKGVSSLSRKVRPLMTRSRSQKGCGSTVGSSVRTSSQMSRARNSSLAEQEEDILAAGYIAVAQGRRPSEETVGHHNGGH
jgi:hypothetical protein